MEMWALFNFCAPDVLGDAPEFRHLYEKVITVGSDKHATVYERERGAVAAARLRQLIGPYMLRREKKDVFKSSSSSSLTAVGGNDCGGSGVEVEDEHAAEAGGSSGSGGVGAAGAVAPAPEGEAAAVTSGGAQPSAMPHKNDFIVWLRLKPMQRKVYQAFLNSGALLLLRCQYSTCSACLQALPLPPALLLQTPSSACSTRPPQRWQQLPC